jgi:hypothetical protein
MTSDIEKIEQRNSLRRDAGLPVLNISEELAKLQSDRFQAEFEREFDLNRHRLKHLWTDNDMGWLSRMGRWNEARARLRDAWSMRIRGDFGPPIRT